MTDPIVKATDSKKRGESTRPRQLRPGLRANIEVRLALKEPARKDRDRPIFMADVEIPGPG